MDIKETENKLIKFCEGLFREDLLSQEDLEKCRISFNVNDASNSLNNGIDNILLTNNHKNYGMSPDQSFNNTDLILQNNKYIECRLVNYQRKSIDRENIERIKYTLYSTSETDKTLKYLYIKNMEDLSSITDNEKIMKNITFKIEKVNVDDYVIMNYHTGELLKCNLDKRVILDGLNKTDSSYFKLHKQNKSFRFESKVFPNHFIDASNPIYVSQGSRPTQFWKLEIISKEEDKLSNNTDNLNADITRNLINKFIKNYSYSRMDYMIIQAKIKYIDLLQQKTRSILNREGVIIEYIRNRIDNGELKLNEKEVMDIESSIYSEVINNEIIALENEKNDLKLQANKINNTILINNIKNVDKINDLIDKAIENTKTQLETLNDILDKVNNETKLLVESDTIIKDNINKKKSLNEKSDINTELVNIQNKSQTHNYRILIFILLCIICLIIYLVFTLINKIQLELK